MGRKSDLTVCMAQYAINIPYGIIKYYDDSSFVDDEEKPDQIFMVNEVIFG